MDLTMPLVVGAVIGLGLYALVRALMPSKRSAISQVARIDAMRARGSAYESARAEREKGRLGALRAEVGLRVSEFYLQQGWEQRSLRADLAVLDRSWEKFLATKVLLGVAGLFFGPLLFAIVYTLGFGRSPIIPVWLALLFGVIFFFLPDLEVRRDAAEKRRDLRRVIGAYLDLVSMSLAGGRGLPEALMAAAEISDGWANPHHRRQPVAGPRRARRGDRRRGTQGPLRLPGPGRGRRCQGPRVPRLPRRDHAAPRTRRDRGQRGREVPVDARGTAAAVRRVPGVPDLSGGDAGVPGAVSRA